MRLMVSAIVVVVVVERRWALGKELKDWRRAPSVGGRGWRGGR